MLTRRLQDLPSSFLFISFSWLRVDAAPSPSLLVQIIPICCELLIPQTFLLTLLLFPGGKGHLLELKAYVDQEVNLFESLISDQPEMISGDSTRPAAFSVTTICEQTSILYLFIAHIRILNLQICSVLCVEGKCYYLIFRINEDKGIKEL